MGANSFLFELTLTEEVDKTYSRIVSPENVPIHLKNLFRSHRLQYRLLHVTLRCHVPHVGLEQVSVSELGLVDQLPEYKFTTCYLNAYY